MEVSINEIDVDRDLFELGMDSLALIRLLGSIETELNVLLPFEAAFSCGRPTVANLSKLFD
ncbi:acyl carrier protein [Bradyrhizobium guangzhouense]|uniref:acyl carrier protein n=1 Tax=Bradyrhizobium guangzhouense TaxID=1325095 RepID=UPI0013E8CCD9|nr:acyl carrier protein [Bradyrhizobium guangzhouense]